MDVKLYIKEAQALVDDAIRTLPFLRAAEDRKRKAKYRDANAKLWWLFAPIAIIVWILRDFNWAMSVVAIGYALIYFANMYEERKHKKLMAHQRARYGYICDEWAKKFGSKSDLYELEMMLIQETKIGELHNQYIKFTDGWFVDVDSERFKKWWLHQRTRLTNFAAGNGDVVTDVSNKWTRMY